MTDGWFQIQLGLSFSSVLVSFRNTTVRYYVCIPCPSFPLFQVYCTVLGVYCTGMHDLMISSCLSLSFFVFVRFDDDDDDDEFSRSS